MAPIQAVVFDVYATLVHNEPELWQQTFAHLVQEQRLAVDPRELYERWRALERGFRTRRVNLETLEQALPFESYEQAWRGCFGQVFAQMRLPGDPDRAVRRCLEAQASRQIFPDTMPVLTELYGHYKLGVLSNADSGYLTVLLEGTSISERLDALLSSEEAQAYKPVPGPFLEVLSRLGVRPEHAVYVGDSPLDDVLGAQNAGMRAVWLNRQGAVLDTGLHRPDAEIRSLTELSALLNRPDSQSGLSKFGPSKVAGGTPEPT
ncbi:MAG: HAD family hydrolase [Dehalococcoidia bacterium]|nr:HAD family hydrolase [Dehalococcoidia bacterium]